jgi:hypothetical protein
MALLYFFASGALQSHPEISGSPIEATPESIAVGDLAHWEGTSDHHSK